MVDYDVRVFIPNTKENKRKLEEKGITQYSEVNPVGIEWYVGTREVARSPHNFCNPHSDKCPLEKEEEINNCERFLDWREKCPVIREVYTDFKLVEEAYEDLIYEEIEGSVLMIYGNKKDSDDELTEVFKAKHFWEALEKLKEWVGDNFDKILIFGNDDLNGWEISDWKGIKDSYVIEAIKVCRNHLFNGGKGCHFYAEEIEEKL